MNFKYKGRLVEAETKGQTIRKVSAGSASESLDDLHYVRLADSALDYSGLDGALEKVRDEANRQADAIVSGWDSGYGEARLEAARTCARSKVYKELLYELCRRVEDEHRKACKDDGRNWHDNARTLLGIGITASAGETTEYRAELGMFMFKVDGKDDITEKGHATADVYVNAGSPQEAERKAYRAVEKYGKDKGWDEVHVFRTIVFPSSHPPVGKRGLPQDEHWEITACTGARAGQASKARRPRVLASSWITLTEDDERCLLNKYYYSEKDIERIKEAIGKLSFHVYDFGKGTKTEIPASSATDFVDRESLVSAIAEAILGNYGYGDCKTARSRDGSEQFLHITTAGAARRLPRSRNTRR